MKRVEVDALTRSKDEILRRAQLQHEHGDVCLTVMGIRSTDVDEGTEILEAFIAKEADRAVQEFATSFDWRHDGHLANPGSKLYVTKEDIDKELTKRRQNR